MKHECKITVLETKCFPELQKQYLADPGSGPCPFFKHERLDQRRPHDDRLLQRRHEAGHFRRGAAETVGGGNFTVAAG